MVRTCYYELLGVERNASESDLKKAYRKQALVWHPDKNHGNTEETTRIFAEIKEAYETLSDPQERTWYDNHREQILRGDDDILAAASSTTHNQSSNVSFTSTDSLMRFFSVSSFSGIDDTPTGFYTTYRQLFDNLRNEELEIFDPATEYMVDQLSNLSFGDSYTAYDEDEIYAGSRSRAKKSKRDAGTGKTLRDFYNFWTTFTTRKSFGWFDRFRLSDAENRQIRRLMEKENKKLREKAKNEFVETVQKLAIWLRKRDPRYKRHVEKQKDLQQDREKERKRRVAEQRAAVLESANTYVRQSWEIVDESDSSDEYLSESSSADIDQDVDFMADSSDISGGAGDNDDILDPENDLSCFICDKVFKSVAQKANHEQSKKHQKAAREIRREMLREERRMARANGSNNVTSGVFNEDIASEKLDTLSGAQESEAESDPHITASDGLQTGDEDGDEDKILAQMMGTLCASQTKKERKESENAQPQQSDALLDDEPVSPPTHNESVTSPVLLPSDTTEDSNTQARSKKELRRERQKSKSHSETICNVCNKEFNSRNQLFNHIKDTGHALASKLPKKLAEQIVQERTLKGKRGKKAKK
ncbi:hypothetical protein GGH99_006030 [Coemansia sp. RSA 1285]|nr:hypothetical protein EV177_007143 [Coemansia sp. RSA 1804]KAJ2673614.1 hypothetical protein GGH99_006030 [Coemansia sp. RSA 1285]